MTPTEAGRQLSELIVAGRLELPHPGAGRTSERWLALFGLARHDDVSVARLAEAHVDAVAIIHEAGLEPVPGARYGVWASVGPGGRDVTLAADGSISGTKPFCSGLGIVDRALVDVDAGGRRRLVDVDVRAGTTIGFTSEWGTDALAATATGGVCFDNHPVADERHVGVPGWYLDRVGFWHGACGPAACWAGGAAGLVDRCDAGDDPHRLARYGALLAEVELLGAVLADAGRRIDESPIDATGARATALATRYVVHESCDRILGQFARAFGPRALIDASSARRFADTQLYIRQFHADHDLVALARTGRRP